MRSINSSTSAMLAIGSVLCASVIAGPLPAPVSRGPQVVLRQGDRYAAPTPSLTAVANAIRVEAKSTSVRLKVPASVPVTNPVEISVAYLSPVQTQRRTQTYNPAAGTNMLYREDEGDGKPRLMHLDITLRELVAGGKSFSFSTQLNVVPLYNVTISSLRFHIMTKCDFIGKSDIELRWKSPEGRITQTKFKLGFDGSKSIAEFHWRGDDVTTEANLREPLVTFREQDPRPQYKAPFDNTGPSLLPGPARQDYNFILKDGDIGPPGSPLNTGCKAQITYNINRELQRF